ncbi:UNVERIFIED_CONTAM: hypothetical protein K2H54_050365 [Gekko kuhli]
MSSLQGRNYCPSIDTPGLNPTTTTGPNTPKAHQQAFHTHQSPQGPGDSQRQQLLWAWTGGGRDNQPASLKTNMDPHTMGCQQPSVREPVGSMVASLAVQSLGLMEAVRQMAVDLSPTRQQMWGHKLEQKWHQDSKMLSQACPSEELAENSPGMHQISKMSTPKPHACSEVGGIWLETQHKPREK